MLKITSSKLVFQVIVYNLRILDSTRTIKLLLFLVDQSLAFGREMVLKYIICKQLLPLTQTIAVMLLFLLKKITIPSTSQEVPINVRRVLRLMEQYYRRPILHENSMSFGYTKQENNHLEQLKLYIHDTTNLR